MNRGLLRKSLHAVLAVCLLGVVEYAGQVGVLAVSACLLAVFTMLRVRSPKLLHGVVRPTYGEFWYLGGVTLAAVLILPLSFSAFQASLLVLGFADPVASFVGGTWGRQPYLVWGEQKTVEGSVACSLVSGCVFLWFGMALVPTVVSGVGMACVEAVAPKGSDNLFLPLAAGLCAIVFV